VKNSHNIRITKNELFECGTSGVTGDAGLEVYGSSDITIDHNYFTNIGPKLLAIFGNNDTNVSVDHNQFYRTSGGAVFWNSSGISVATNRFQDMVQRVGVGPGGFVQFMSVTGANNRIACNLGSNDPAVVPQSGDLINLYTSNGTADDPIQVYGNRLIGTGVNLTGDGLASVGIQTGDGSFSSFIRVFWNQLVNTGGGGIGVSGGNDIEVFGNRIYEGGRGGAYTSGMGVVNFYGAPDSWNIPGAYCRNINVHDNAISMSPDNQSRALITDWTALNNWPNCESVTSENNDLFATQDGNIVDAPAPGCSE
jgi:hypothetical protein